jgi:hypothetical protein
MTERMLLKLWKALYKRTALKPAGAFAVAYGFHFLLFNLQCARAALRSFLPTEIFLSGNGFLEPRALTKIIVIQCHGFNLLRVFSMNFSTGSSDCCMRRA